MYQPRLDPGMLKRQLLEATGGCEYCEYKHIRQVLNYSQRAVRKRMEHVAHTGERKAARFPIEQAAYALANYQYGDGKRR